MNEMDFFYLLDFLNKLDDFILIVLISSLKFLRTKEEVRILLIDLFGPEETKMIPEIEPNDLLNLAKAEFNTRNLN
jgi:hypothetical protein